VGWQVIIAPSAESDLADIVRYIARHNSVGTARCAVRARKAGATSMVKSAFCPSLPAALPPRPSALSLPTKPYRHPQFRRGVTPRL